MATINLTQYKTAFVLMGWDSKGDKHPRFLEQWQNATQKSQAAIDTHFTSYKDAGIALLTGREAGFTVIDFDSKDNPLFTQLVQACPTYWVKTRKGFHLYYEYTGEFVTGTNRFGKGVDVRNDGGLVFCPPTKNYEGSEDAIEPLNEDALELLRAAYTPGHAPTEKELKNTETRNDSLFRKACGWVNVYDKQEVWNRMVKANKSFKKGELSDEELDILYNQVIAYAENPKKVATTPIADLGLLVTETANKTIYNLVTANIFRILENHPEYAKHFRFDDWTQKAQILDGSTWRELRDDDIVPIQMRISTLYEQFRGLKKEMTEDAIMAACYHHRYDSAQDWLKSLTWDGIMRLEGWLSEVYGVENDSYHNAVGANWMKGLAKRIMIPGCQFDAVLIIKGRQGCGKSTSLQILGEDWYTETTMRADSKDFFIQLQGKAIVEFAEGETLSKTETKQMKAVISARFDNFRPPYGRVARDYPRRCVFAMTTNQDKPLKDETGNRRFFPIEVVADRANLEWLKEYRKQLFAEAYHRVMVLHDSVHEYPANVAEIQEQSVEESPYEDDIRRWIENEFCKGVADVDSNGLSVTDVWFYALGGDKHRIDRRIQMNIAAALKALGWERRKILVEKSRLWRWFNSKQIRPWKSSNSEDDGGRSEVGHNFDEVGTKNEKYNNMFD